MKLSYLALISLLGLSPLAFAAEAKVELTSFVAAGLRTRAAEICGKVTGAKNSPTYVRIVVDEKSNRPGVYNVVAGNDGAFCVTVVSYQGTAVASLWETQGTAEAGATSIVLQPAQER